MNFHLNLAIVFILNCRFISAVEQELECRCSTEIFDSFVSSGVFKSPNFPKHYCNDMNCVYDIEPKLSEAVSLVVEIFHTEASHDYVEVYQMINWQTSLNTSSGFQFIKQHVLSGTDILQSHFYSSIGGGLRLVFITDATESEYPGFQMSFQRFPLTSSRHFPCPSPVFHMATNKIQHLPVFTIPRVMDSSCAFQINSTEAIQINVTTISPAVTVKVYETESFNSNLYSLERTLAAIKYGSNNRNVTSRSSSVIVILSFTASLLLSYQTYSIEFRRVTSICACPAKSISLTADFPAFFISPGYPLEYCNELNCSSDVTALSTSTNISWTPVVRAKLNGLFMMEADVDYLEMIDKKALIALSGHAKKISYFTFDHHQVSLRFLTDNSLTESGFNISLEVYSKPYYCLCPGTPQMLQDMNHTLDFTFDAHCAFMDCFWQIRPPQKLEELGRAVSATTSTTEEPSSESLYRIVLNVGFQLEASTDFIEVVNGKFSEKNLEHTRLDVDMMSEEGEQQHRSLSYENAHLVTLWYHREGDPAVLPRSLHVDYQWREKCLCGNSFLKAQLDQCHQLTSPDYPLVYCNDLHCEYHIVAEPGLRVVLNVKDFFTEVNQDYLFVFEGNSSQTKHLQALSGIELAIPAIRSQGNVITLLFTTDVSLSMRGYNLCYNAEMTVEYKLQLEQEEADRQASSTKAVWMVCVLVALLLVFLCSTALLLFYIHSNQMVGHDDSSVRFVREPRTESQFSLINPVFQSITSTRQN